MYRLSRLLMMVAVLAALCCLAIVVAMGWPMTGWVIGGIVAIRVFRRRGGYLTTLGSARWVEESELRSAGMIDAESGLILGRLPVTRRFGLNPGIRRLFAWRTKAKSACWEFLAWPLRRRGPLVRLPRAVHTAVFSPSGGGKGVSCVVPFLLTCNESCVVVDFKGENAKLTAEHRRKAFGHRIVLLDPFKVATQRPDRFDPIDFIDKDSPCAIDECNDLANALVVRTGEEREPHWNDSAEAWIAATVATVVHYGEQDGARSLQMVSEVLSDPEKTDTVVKLMRESDCWGRMLFRKGGQLLRYIEKEKNSTLTTVTRHLRFLDTPIIAESTKSSSFDPADLRKGKMTVYLILPPEHMRANSALLRMWIGSLLRAVIRGGLQERNKVHFVLDEAASLGHLDAVDDAVDKYRGYSIRLQFYFQSLGQLKASFPDGREQTLLSNCSQIFFGVNDNATADFVSARIGDGTVIVESGGTSWGSSYQSAQGAQSGSSSQSVNGSSNWQQQSRRLLKPEEVIALPERIAITFTPGVPPVWTTLLRYYEEGWLWRRRGWFARGVAAMWMFACSSLLCAGMLAAAAALSDTVDWANEWQDLPASAPDPQREIFPPAYGNARPR